MFQQQRMQTVDTEPLVYRLVVSRAGKWLLALGNRLPVKWDAFPLRVGGFRMVAPTFDRFMALWAWKLGLVEAYEGEVLRGLCREGMVAADIGANIGWHTIELAQFGGSAGKVWAFEPEPRNFHALCRNIEANRCTTVHAVNAAAGAMAGETTLWVSKSHGGDHRTYRDPADPRQRHVSVRILSLDEFWGPDARVDVVKMDVQGAEGQVLAGMRRTMRANPQMCLMMEFWPQGLSAAGSDPESVLRMMQEEGFGIGIVNGVHRRTDPVHDISALVKGLSGGRSVNLLLRR